MAISRKRSFRSRIFISFFAAFTIFAGATILFQFDREKKYRAAQLENTLDNITAFTHNYITENSLIEKNNIQQLDSLLNLLPITNQRLTVIDKQGLVIYDSEVDDITEMENHLMRPEVQKSFYSEKGSSIRTSATTQQDYYYYSISYNDYFIRTAVVYDVQVKDFLKTERIFLIFIISLFIVGWFMIAQLTKWLSQFISKLQDIAVSASVGEEIEKSPEFPDRELDIISRKIISIYNNLNKAKYKLEVERNKLYEHINVLAEGIAMFSKKDEIKLSNKLYIQYLNLISEKSTISMPNIFEIESLKPIISFVKENQNEQLKNLTELPTKSITIHANEHYFQIEAMVFLDKSYQILISDITKLEKRRLLKQQLTSNIAHELKTPVTSMKGYLETILNSPNLPEDKQRHFIERTYIQSERLTELLNDISLINNIEDAGELFEFRDFAIRDSINEVVENRRMQLDEKNIKCIVDIKDNTLVNGNDSLISSAIQNLIENSIKYAGENINIIIKKYHSDEKRHYFSYVDTGSGIPEEHQPRIFERFYRIDEGRSRKTGGTGLGLSIVKNAILLHKGEITVSNRVEGGVEFLFTLPKS